MNESTLCWDCRLATTGECRWSRKLKPVKGWEVEERKDGLFVKSCPKFVRDAWGGGVYRTEEEYRKYLREAEERRKEKEKRMNKLTIIGNLTGDPELRSTTTGKSVCSFSVAVNRRGKEETDYFRVSAWDKLGENCQKFLGKGRKVCVVGPVEVRPYMDKQGNAKASMEVTAQEVEFLDKSTVDQKTGFTKIDVNDALPWEV